MTNEQKTVSVHVIKIAEHESVLTSWLRDASSFALAIALIGVGVLLSSVVMQIIGAVIFFIISHHLGGKTIRTMTIQDARKYLDGLEDNE